MYNSIITHDDFDGIACAVICSFAYKIDDIRFTGPSAIEHSRIPITTQDIVCDLPYPLECGLWFDHHQGNLDDLQYRKIDICEICGKFDLAPSCARVVFEHLRSSQKFPPYFETLVAEADIIDSFDFNNIEEWRRETPGKIIDATLKLKTDNPTEKRLYLNSLVKWLSENSIDIVSNFPEIKDKYKQFQDQETEMLSIIENSAGFLPEDKNHEIIIIDLTTFNRLPHIIKNLAYLIYPDSLAVLETHNLFNRGIKSNDLSFSMSLSINLNKQQHKKDVGEIMRELNIGNGHAGAAAGKIYCSSKQEMIKTKTEILSEIFSLWKNQ